MAGMEGGIGELTASVVLLIRFRGVRVRVGFVGDFPRFFVESVMSGCVLSVGGFREGLLGELLGTSISFNATRLFLPLLDDSPH